ncbi:DUF6177 family protein [Actinomadura miaoliensis]|uniref:Uncharacterized protein n=1 Tax=Actinomadura miaoliensis TaxID=430685 RepID=A0ABP7V5X4_9ACTN
MEHPAVDLCTDLTGLLIVNRPVVSLSVRMAEALRFCAETERQLVIAGHAGGRLTLPLRLMLGPAARWAVKDCDGVYYDGLNGAVLRWDGAAFVPQIEGTEAVVHSRFPSGPPPEGLQLLVTATVRHPATEGLVLGEVTEILHRELTGNGPQGWGACEPAAIPWHKDALTALCRERSPEPTRLVCVGDSRADRRAIGTLEVDRAESGVEETTTVAVGLRPDDSLPDLAELADRIGSHFGLASMTAQAVPGRRDLTTEPRFNGLPAPVGVAVTAEAMRQTPANGTLDVTGMRVRHFDTGGAWYGVGEGRDPEDWAKFQAVMAHFGPAEPS